MALVDWTGWSRLILWKPVLPGAPGPTAPADHVRTPALEIAGAFAYARRYDGRRQVHHADHVMARITAERLVPAAYSCVGADAA